MSQFRAAVSLFCVHACFCAHKPRGWFSNYVVCTCGYTVCVCVSVLPVSMWSTELNMWSDVRGKLLTLRPLSVLSLREWALCGNTHIKTFLCIWSSSVKQLEWPAEILQSHWTDRTLDDNVFIWRGIERLFGATGTFLLERLLGSFFNTPIKPKNIAFMQREINFMGSWLLIISPLMPLNNDKSVKNIYSAYQ